MKNGPQNTSRKWRPQGDSNPCYRRERAIFAAILSIFLYLFGHVVDVSADSITVSELYNTATPCGDGCWQQKGQKYDFDLTGEGYSIEYSRMLVKGRLGLSISIGYADLGEVNGGGEFISDKDYINRKRGVVSCFKCLDRSYAYTSSYEGEMEFVYVSVDPSFKFTENLEGYLKAGYAVWKGTFRLKSTWHHAPDKYDEPGYISNVMFWEEIDISPYLGAGVSYSLSNNQAVVLSCYWLKDSRPPESVVVANYGAGFGYRYSF